MLYLPYHNHTSPARPGVGYTLWLHQDAVAEELEVVVLPGTIVTVAGDDQVQTVLRKLLS